MRICVGSLGSVLEYSHPTTLNPLSVLSEISLSGLPKPRADLIGFCLALLHAGQPFHPFPETSGIPLHRSIGLGSFLFCCQRSPTAPRDATFLLGERSFLRILSRDSLTDSYPPYLRLFKLKNVRFIHIFNLTMMNYY